MDLSRKLTKQRHVYTNEVSIIPPVEEQKQHHSLDLQITASIATNNKVGTPEIKKGLLQKNSIHCEYVLHS